MLTVRNNSRIRENPFLLFSPFLVLYIVWVLLFHTNILDGDETRYYGFAENLLHGFYSPSSPNISLPQGPGYPILIMPFAALHLPLLLIKLLNAVFLYLSVVLLFKTLKQFVPFRIAFLVSLFWGCYYHAYEKMHFILSETFTTFLMSLLMFYLVKAFDPATSPKTKKYIYLSGFIIGYIALTKVIFGYVLLFMITGAGLLWIINRKAVNYRKSIFILLVALATTSPYLIYTYRLSGRMFYWGTLGGDNLYWMSTPYKGEYGSWYSLEAMGGDSLSLPYQIPGTVELIKANHGKDYEEIYKYRGVEQDDAYKRIAIQNIRSHPAKFAENCISNIGRMLFNYPNSNAPQRPGNLSKLPLNGIIVVLSLFCLIPTFINWRKIIFPIRFMLFFSLLYFGGSILGSAEIRMFALIVPPLLFWLAYIMQKTIKINLKFGHNAGQ